MSLNLFTTFGDRVRLRVDEVLGNRNCQWPASEDEKSLLSALLAASGKQRAIPREVLSKRVGVSDRAIRDMVHNLRLNFLVQIGSVRTGDGGYYLMDDEQDCINSSQMMIGHGVAIIRAGLAMRGGKLGITELMGQLGLALEAEAKEHHS